MKRMLVVFAMIAATLSAASAADEPAFEFELHQRGSHRGVGVEGYVRNPLPWRITNVHLQVDGIDADGAIVSSSSGWVLGSVNAGGRGYFYVPVSAPAASYRASVRAFDKVTPDSFGVQAP